ncbi:MAG TPA: hypothetical protein VIT92_11525 [Burkholderiaceae bacterium]
MTRRLWMLAPLALMVAALLAAAFLPLPAGPREELFEIPKGTWQRRMAGDKASILPEKVTLTLGVRDVLLLRNSDTVPQIFGPVLIMPGQDFRLPFEQAGDHPFDCSAHASGQMMVAVLPEPTVGWQRLRWRALTFFDRLK